MTAQERWQNSIGEGIFFDVVNSQDIVSRGVMPSVDNFDYAAVKFGGDWGGLWGNPETWGTLSKNGRPVLIPFLYCVPEYYAKYRDIVGGFIEDGFPAVILDCEKEWEGNESVLYQLLQSLNVENNLIGVTGYAWFNGWQDDGKAFSDVLKSFDIVYLPQCYLSYFENIEFGIELINHYQTTRLTPLPQAPIYDNVAWGTKPLSSLSLPPWLWHYVEPVTPPVDKPVTNTPTISDQINTALGQGLTYCDQLRPLVQSTVSMAAIDLLSAIETTMHTARKLNGGE